jgi:hypothetical protein
MTLTSRKELFLRSSEFEAKMKVAKSSISNRLYKKNQAQGLILTIEFLRIDQHGKIPSSELVLGNNLAQSLFDQGLALYAKKDRVNKLRGIRKLERAMDILELPIVAPKQLPTLPVIDPSAPWLIRMIESGQEAQCFELAMKQPEKFKLQLGLCKDDQYSKTLSKLSTFVHRDRYVQHEKYFKLYNEVFHQLETNARPTRLILD